MLHKFTVAAQKEAMKLFQFDWHFLLVRVTFGWHWRVVGDLRRADFQASVVIYVHFVKSVMWK